LRRERGEVRIMGAVQRM